jgi:hypothetical protein
VNTQESVILHVTILGQLEHYFDMHVGVSQTFKIKINCLSRLKSDWLGMVLVS